MVLVGSATFPHTHSSGPANVRFSLAPYEDAFLSFMPDLRNSATDLWAYNEVR